MRFSWLLTCMLFSVIACNHEDRREEAVYACVGALHEYGSSNVSERGLSEDFSYIRVRDFTATELVVLSFGRRPSNVSSSVAKALEHTQGIICLVDGSGTVTGLSSPESIGVTTEIVDFVPGFEETEAKAMLSIDESIRAGSPVTVRQTSFTLSEGRLSRVGDSIVSILESDDWAVLFE